MTLWLRNLVYVCWIIQSWKNWLVGLDNDPLLCLSHFFSSCSLVFVILFLIFYCIINIMFIYIKHVIIPHNTLIITCSIWSNESSILCRSAWHWMYQLTYNHCLRGIQSRLTIWQILEFILPMILSHVLQVPFSCICVQKRILWHDVWNAID